MFRNLFDTTSIVGKMAAPITLGLTLPASAVWLSATIRQAKAAVRQGFQGEDGAY